MDSRRCGGDCDSKPRTLKRATIESEKRCRPRQVTPVAAFERDHSQSRLETARLAAAIPFDVGDVEVCESDVGCEFRSFHASDRDRGAVGSGLPVVTYASGGYLVKLSAQSFQQGSLAEMRFGMKGPVLNKSSGFAARVALQTRSAVVLRSHEAVLADESGRGVGQ